MAAGDIIVLEGEDTEAKKGVYFDGTDDYILADAHAVARVAANDTVGTYSAWIYLDSITGNKTILSSGDNDSATEGLWFVVAANQLGIQLYHGGATQFNVVETTSSMVARTWTHVAVVQDGTQPALYVNGSAVDTTNSTATDLTMWYDELTGCDKFAVGVKESNNTHTNDFTGAIGQVKYWNKALTAAEVLDDYNGVALSDDGTYLQFNLTMADNGTTDSGLGADDGTLTGDAHYGGWISTWSRAIERNVTGHAAETINFVELDKLKTIIRRGD